MDLHLNFKSRKAPYAQIVDQVKHAAASGALRAGESLPSIRPLAEQLRVNRNTVAKAYAELENQGVIQSVPGRGCFLVENSSPLKKTVRQQMLHELIDALIVEAHHLRFTQADLRALIEERLRRFETANSVSEVKKEET